MGEASDNQSSGPRGKLGGPGGLAKAARRKAIGADGAELVVSGPLGARAIPFAIRPAVDGLDLVSWAEANRARIEDWLFEHRALLFRGFGVRDVATFDRFVGATSDGAKLEYKDRTTPREDRGTRIYTSTVHPPEERIELHNEGTYWVRWAAKLYFLCLRASATGGETPIADVRRVHDRIDPEIRARFAERGLMLVRNFNQGFGLPWQEVFQTSEPKEVEAYCAANDIQLEWQSGGRLRTRQVRPAIRRHPKSGEPVWFNHGAFFHHTSLAPALRSSLEGEYGIERLPYNTCYGDGSAIEPEVAAHLRAAYAAERVLFPWRDGDVMLLDNMSVAHAREPYTGAREVVVAMTDAVDPERV
jgi:alpha-ketoglutarate-dependent taurine dioxygenase